MPEVNQYNFTFKEIATLLVKASGIHEGKWQVAFNLGVVVGTFATDANTTLPGALTQINSVGLQRVPPDTPINDLIVVDAAEVNRQTKKSKQN